MNKKGFTLVEILAVISIIGVLLLIIIPNVDKALKKSETVIYDVQLNNILNATYDYTLKKLSFLPEDDEVKYITLNELKFNGLINENIKDTKTGKKFNNDLVISIRKKHSNYKNYKNYVKKGDYIYKIEDETTLEKKPIFSFEGYESVPTLINVDIGDEFEELECNAKTYNGNDISEKIVKNIIYNSSSIDKVNTMKAGIYYIDYCVVDDEGYSNCVKVNVVITDLLPPSFNEFENVTISTSVETYNLMNGVSCTDNSGKCNITINGDIKYGVVGKYVIEYKTTDSSGNTTTKERVITIE